MRHPSPFKKLWQSIPFSHRLILDKTMAVVCIDEWNADGSQKAYQFLITTTSKAAELSHALEQPDFDPNLYGTIICQGHGAPDAETIAHMVEHYGYNPGN